MPMSAARIPLAEKLGAALEEIPMQAVQPLVDGGLPVAPTWGGQSTLQHLEIVLTPERLAELAGWPNPSSGALIVMKNQAQVVQLLHRLPPSMKVFGHRFASTAFHGTAAGPVAMYVSLGDLFGSEIRQIEAGDLGSQPLQTQTHATDHFVRRRPIIIADSRH